MKRIGILTSGGDAPGMNAGIRAVVRAAIYYNLEVYGIYHGYQGMIDGEIDQLTSQSVSNIIQRGGTILKSARCEQFYHQEGRQKAYDQLLKHQIEAVVTIGGDGTFTGAHLFSEEFKIPFIGMPGTIDNDLIGTDFTIGYDTAINTAVEAIDKIRDTASSHDRLFFVEVMGKDAGFIALRSGIAAGAEAILIPEYQMNIDELVNTLEAGWHKQKSSSIVIVAEGDEEGGAFTIAKKVKKRFNRYDTRVTILGHLQRGGSPTTMDRVLASQLGVAAVEALLEGKNNVMVGLVNKQIVYTPFDNAIKHTDQVNPQLLRIAQMLSSL